MSEVYLGGGEGVIPNTPPLPSQQRTRAVPGHHCPAYQAGAFPSQQQLHYSLIPLQRGHQELRLASFSASVGVDILLTQISIYQPTGVVFDSFCPAYRCPHLPARPAVPPSPHALYWKRKGGAYGRPRQCIGFDIRPSQ